MYFEFSYGNITQYNFFCIFETLGRIQIKIEIPIRLIPKIYLAYRAQFQILNMKG